MASSVILKNLENTEFSIQHNDGEGAVSITSTQLKNITGAEEYTNLYVSTDGSSSGTGLSSSDAVDNLSTAIGIINNNKRIKWNIVVSGGTYNHTSQVFIDGCYIKISCASAIIDLTHLVNDYGINITNSYVEIDGVTINNSDYSAINVGINSFAKVSNSSFNNNGWRGIQARDGGEIYVSSCNSYNNGLSGFECLLNAKGTFYNCTADNNGWAGYTATNSSIVYVNGSTADGNTRYGFECAGSSMLYGRDLDVTNGSDTAAAYLCSGSSEMTLHTTSTINCGRPYMAEYGAILSGIGFTVDAGTSNGSRYSAFYSEYGSNISLISTSELPINITGFDLGFKAEYGSKITSTKPGYTNFVNMITQSSPPINIVDNSNSFVDMEVDIGTEVFPYGTFTPTISHDTNIASSTPNQCMYSRVGNIVTVSGSVSITPTAIGSINFNMSLPVNSNITAYTQVAGSGRSYTNVPGDTIAINGDSTNDEADCRGNASTTSAQIYLFTFQYQVL